MKLTEEQCCAIVDAICDCEGASRWKTAEQLRGILAAHNAEAQSKASEICTNLRQIVADDTEKGWRTNRADWCAQAADYIEAAQPQPMTGAARDAKRYHGRTLKELKEICATRPARYPQAHHDFDKTILALIAEIEHLDQAKGE